MRSSAQIASASECFLQPKAMTGLWSTTIVKIESDIQSAIFPSPSASDKAAAPLCTPIAPVTSAERTKPSGEKHPRALPRPDDAQTCGMYVRARQPYAVLAVSQRNKLV